MPWGGQGAAGLAHCSVHRVLPHKPALRARARRSWVIEHDRDQRLVRLTVHGLSRITSIRGQEHPRLDAGSRQILSAAEPRLAFETRRRASPLVAISQFFDRAFKV